MQRSMMTSGSALRWSSSGGASESHKKMWLEKWCWSCTREESIFSRGVLPSPSTTHISSDWIENVFFKLLPCPVWSLLYNLIKKLIQQNNNLMTATTNYTTITPILSFAWIEAWILSETLIPLMLVDLQGYNPSGWRN